RHLSYSTRSLRILPGEWSAAPLGVTQPGDPLGRRRVGGEQVGELDLTAGERVHDVLLGLRGLDVHGDASHADLQLLEGPGQRLAVADEAGAGTAGLELAASAEGPLAPVGGQRGGGHT